jgi:hypothetical protein
MVEGEMSRRRYISTEISVDKKIRRLSDSAALLYTWMVPHAEEDATITSDPEELQAIVVPNRPGWSASKVERCLDEIKEAGLVMGVNGTIYFPPTSFYKYQSNVHADRRRNEQPLQTTDNSAEQRATAQNSASPSPSPSPSKHIVASDESTVFAYWKQVMGKNGRTALDPPRKTAIQRALKVLSVDDCRRAIEGCRNTPHNMGDNERGERYNDLTLIFRDAAHWERFMERGTYRAGDKPADPRARRERIERARNEYRAGQEDAARAMCNPDEWAEVIA